jgi:DNA-binding beta-propeller fold protein YncE
MHHTGKTHGRFVFFTLCMFLCVLGCSLYLDDEEPDHFYEFKDFEILKLGVNISDMVMDPNQPFLYLADYGNNRILRIHIGKQMVVEGNLQVGSHPIDLDITPDQRHLVVGLNGESNLKIIDLSTFAIVKTVPFSLNDISHIVCGTDSIVYVSSLDEPLLIAVSIVDDLETSGNVRSGTLLMNHRDRKLFVAARNNVLKYDASGHFPTTATTSTRFSFSARINDFVMGPLNDHLYLGLADPLDRDHVKDLWSFSTDNLTLTGKYEIKSPALGLALSRDGRRLFVAPTDADEAGVFIVEFDTQTKLEKNYFLAAGNLKERGIAIDNNDQYLYVAVFTPGDDDTFEPYNVNSYDLQRIRVD